ncbi:MAG: hypothetical protein Q9183_005386 [Haloplaca sp. 2 TL-2023]
MSASGIELPKSARSGHPVFTSNNGPSKPTPTQTRASSHIPSLTERFGYVSPDTAKKTQEHLEKHKSRSMSNAQDAFTKLRARASPILSEALVGSKKPSPSPEPVSDTPLVNSPACQGAKVMKLKRQIIDLVSDDDEAHQPRPKRKWFTRKAHTAARSTQPGSLSHDQSARLKSELGGYPSHLKGMTQESSLSQPSTLPERAQTSFSAPPATPKGQSTRQPPPSEGAQSLNTNHPDPDPASTEEETPSQEPTSGPLSKPNSYKLNNTTLNILAPSPRYDPKVYVPVKLASYPTEGALFATAAAAWDLSLDNLSALHMVLDSNEPQTQGRYGKGTLRLKKGMHDPFECFLELVDMDRAWRGDGGGKLTISVMIEMEKTNCIGERFRCPALGGWIYIPSQCASLFEKNLKKRGVNETERCIQEKCGNL